MRYRVKNERFLNAYLWYSPIVFFEEAEVIRTINLNKRMNTWFTKSKER